MKEAMLYKKLPENRVSCNLCAHHCLIVDAKKGICQVRENQGGTLYTLVYGRTISQNIDPIEKKPLFHFYPGSTAYSIATPGCNFRCAWCQNWEISQMPKQQHLIAGYEATPEEIVTEAQRWGCRSIAYTYTEPTIFFEYAYDTARLARAAGLANIFVTNGYMTEEMLETIQPYLDAANVDLKAFRDKTYRKYVGARLQPVLDSLKAIKQLSIWLEVTTLVIPGINDDSAELEDAAQFIVRELGADTPWHISRFFPDYQLTHVPPTPQKSLERAWEIGKSVGLRYVYLGNVPGEEKQNTYCPDCGTLLIRRNIFGVLANRIQSGCCPDCGFAVGGVGMSEKPHSASLVTRQE
ncbi:MAG: AmmeMemoRadiSam system radical SAM enzyme [Xenococcaceae cyanobacterium MO_167.B27]|nr:AmmeMemoRadiSam system radical SAM enzyme [Xenococcaceae cyanobacterium MO_167.B27]